MRRRTQHAWKEHAHTVQAMTGAVVAIATGVSSASPELASLGLQSVLEMVYERVNRLGLQELAVQPSDAPAETLPSSELISA